MIGTSIRSIRHLWRLSDTSLKYILIRNRENSYDICEMFKTPADYKGGEKLYVFNSYFNHNNHNWQEMFKDFNKQLEGKVEHGRVLGIEKAGKYDSFANYGFILNDYFNEIVLLPDTFNEDFKAFLKANNKVITNINKKYGYDLTTHPITKMLYVFADGSKNFFQWAVNLYFQHGVHTNIIRTILTWNDNYKQLTKNLSKGTITAYTTRDALATLLDELEVLRKEKRINDAINSFNTAQKKLLKTVELSDIDKQTLSRFSKLSEAKKVNFIRKVSTIEDYNELMRLMRHATNVHFEWNKESFMDFINNVEGIKHEIILDQDNIVLAKVDDFETVKQLGKATNWCITKNKSYWNNYIEHHNGKAIQYMLFDFSKLEDDKLSIIGLTTMHNKGITSAHNFNNDNLMFTPKSNLLIDSFLERFNKNVNIYSIINDCGIDINLIAHFDKPLYKWDKDGLMDYLFECVNSENVDVIKSELNDPNKLVLSVRDANIRYFLGDSYIDNISSDYWGSQHILFIDFSKSQYDPDKLEFAIIYDGDLSEDYCVGMYNERSMGINADEFDSKLSEFGLPYDIIRRSDDKVMRYRKAFTNLNIKTIKDEIRKEPSILQDILEEVDQDTIYDTVRLSLAEYSSFDYLNLIYDNGYHFCNFMSSSYCGDLLNTAFKLLRGCIRGIHATLDKPSEELIEQFYNNTIENREEASYVGNYLLFKTILDKEVKDGSINYQDLYYRVLMNIFSNAHKGSCVDEFLLTAHKRINFNVKNDCIKKFIECCVIYGGDELQKIASEVAETNDYTRKIYTKAVEYRNRIKKANENVATVAANAN